MKIVFTTAVLLILSLNATAQNYKMFVSLEDGRKSILTLFRTGYNESRTVTGTGTTDTIMCSGNGFTMSKIDRNLRKYHTESGTTYKAFNKAIRKGRRTAVRSMKGSGSFSFTSGREQVYVNYFKQAGKILMNISIEE